MKFMNMKNIKISKNIKNICASKNLLLIILILFATGFIINIIYNDNYNDKFNDKYNKIIEPYLDSKCLINKDIPKINDKMFELNPNNSVKNSYQCNADTYGSSQLAFYIYNGKHTQYVNQKAGDLFDIIDTPTTTDVSCIINSEGSDFFTNTDGECKYYSFKKSPDFYNSISGSLYVSCPSNNSYNIDNLMFLGVGEFTGSGYDLIKTNFNKYITYANPYCLTDETCKLLLDKYKQSSNSINSETVLNDKLKAMKSNESLLTDYTNCINDGNTNLWSNLGNYITGDNLTGKDYGDSQYITDFITNVNPPLHSEISANVFKNYELIMADYEDKKLDYTSNYLVYIFLTLVTLIAVILLVLSITNPDIVSVELVIGYVILIVAIVFFGTKYFNFFKEDVHEFSHINY